MMFDVLQIEKEGRSERDFQFVVSLFPEVCSLARAFLISIHARVTHLPRVSRTGFWVSHRAQGHKAASIPQPILLSREW